MSREIKFRAWVSQFESYGQVLNIHFSEEGLPEIIEVFIDDSNHHLNALEVILEQYTGLKDKNGKEIYEGDIVRWEVREHQGEASIADDIGEIVWDESCASFLIDHFVALSALEMDVIGNIHETPELLEAEND